MNNQKIEILLQLKKEIKELKKELKEYTILELRTIRNLKISMRIIQLFFPYILCAGITAYGSKITNLGIPFYNGDTFKLNAQIIKEFDNLGNIKIQKQYSTLVSKEPITIKLYQTWKKEEKDFYSRKIEIYQLNDITESEVLELLSQQNLNLNETLGNPNSEYLESRNNLPQEEIEKEAHLSAIMYETDSTDQIIIKETFIQNIASTSLYLLINILISCGIILPIRKKYSNFNFLNSYKEILEQYQYLDYKKIKIKIKQDNYNVLTRKNDKNEL